MRAPKERPIRIVASGFHQTSSGKTWTCIKAITMPTKPRTDPPERSIWRATITRTCRPPNAPPWKNWGAPGGRVGLPAAASIATAASLAGRGRLGWIDPLADLGLGGPLRFDHEVQVPKDDGDGLGQDRVH